jgi:putative transposase
MAQSLSYILVHLIFSTKDRAPVLDSSVRTPLHAYLAAVARDMDCECYRAGGIADHVHLAIRLSRTVTAAELTGKLKTVSSKWIKAKFPRLDDFSWQSGYGAFSLGPSQLSALLHYIDTQEEHHKRKTFQEEYREILGKYGIPCDERYVWD